MTGDGPIRPPAMHRVDPRVDDALDALEKLTVAQRTSQAVVLRSVVLRSAHAAAVWCSLAVIAHAVHLTLLVALAATVAIVAALAAAAALALLTSHRRTRATETNR